MPSMSRARPTVIGRDRERAALAAFLARRDGPAALVLEGQAGIGKTTLWEEAWRAAAADGCLVLHCRPASAESQLAFSAVADLLDGDVVDEALPSLPAPQRRALQAALLREDDVDAAADVRAIAGGLLGVLRHAARRRPVVVAVDDVQWLDGPSRTVLEFVARRTAGVQVVLLVARRSDADEALPLGLSRAQDASRVTRLALEPMSLGALHRLIQDRLFLSLPRPTLRRLHEGSGGNPFYALEIGLALRRRDAPLSVEGALPVPTNLQHLVDERLGALPVDVLELLQRVELLYDRRLDTVHRVALDDGIHHALDGAIEAGVLEVVGDRVAFTHGLLAAAVHGLAGPVRRRELHQRLADAETAGEARALHLALAATGPDPEVAAELEEAATAAARRGAAETAGRLAEHAARLTPDEDRASAARRVVAAADFHMTAGDPRHARALLADVVEQLGPGPVRAEALSMLCWVHPAEGDLAGAILLGEQAIAEAGENLRVITVTHQRLGSLQRIRGDLRASARHSRLAVEGAQRIGDTGLLALGLASLGETELVQGAGVGAGMRWAVELERRLPDFLGQQSPARRLGLALLAIDEFDEARVLFADLLVRAEAAGHEDARAMALSHLVELDRRVGDWDQARIVADQAGELARQVNTQQERNAIVAAEALLLAGLGEVERTREMGLEGLDTATRLGDGICFVLYRSVLGFLDLSLGDPAAAVEWLAPATDLLVALGVVELGLLPEVIHNEIEALLALGRRERAAALVAHVEDLTERNPRPWMRALGLRSRALLLAADGELDEARRTVDAALLAHATVPQPFELARTLMLAGALERRAKQRRASRERLEQAIGILDALPAPLWAARARGELARLGVRPAPSGLSATETQIAQLAANGRSNPEIAAAVFVSRKTVEANLSKIYRKLGVRSRVDLARHFAAGGPPDVGTPGDGAGDRGTSPLSDAPERP
jgi:DNA-binding NarL/FixJ family response regulator